jgi:hypothetical protein
MLCMLELIMYQIDLIPHSNACAVRCQGMPLGAACVVKTADASWQNPRRPAEERLYRFIPVAAAWRRSHLRHWRYACGGRLGSTEVNL